MSNAVSDDICPAFHEIAIDMLEARLRPFSLLQEQHSFINIPGAYSQCSLAARPSQIIGLDLQLTDDHLESVQLDALESLHALL